MFNAIIPLVEPIVAVQVDADELAGANGVALLARLEIYFMRPVTMVSWDKTGQFSSCGYQCPEHALIDEQLRWREFELPAEPEIPF